MNFYLLGGLGNISFQALAVQTLLKKNNVSLSDILIRQNALTRILGWKVHTNMSKYIFKKHQFLEKNCWGNALIDLPLIFLSKITGKSILNRMWIIDPAELSNNYIAVSGYFQNQAVFELTSIHIPHLSNRFYNMSAKTKSNIVLHYRGTDSNWAKSIDNYYLKVSALACLNADIIVVTDDIIKAGMDLFWCDDIRSGTVRQDLALMLNAKIVICAPSTMSWWAAVVSSEAEKVYMPKVLQSLLPDVSDLINVTYV
jgi:hypothetical protein